MTKRAPRKIETLKKKQRRKADRPPQSRIQGNTAGVRTRLKKAAGIARARKAKAAAT